MITPNPLAIQTYQNNYDSVVRSAVGEVGVGESLLELQAMYRNRRVESRTPNQDTIWETLLDNLSPRDIEPIGVEVIWGRRFPVLTKPSFFRLSLPQNPIAMLREYLAKEGAADLGESILSNARLTEGDVRFRTDGAGNSIVISGDSRPNYCSLAGLAHELGHALYEKKVTPSTLFEQVESERRAQQLEDMVLSYYLRASDYLSEWKRYVHAVDTLNMYFFLVEAKELGLNIPASIRFDPHYFDRHSLLLRETYFTAVGYQYVYARASYERFALRPRRRRVEYI